MGLGPTLFEVMEGTSSCLRSLGSVYACTRAVVKVEGCNSYMMIAWIWLIAIEFIVMVHYEW